MVLPRMFIESRATGSWARAVIFTLRRAVFICGDTLVMVPCTTVPFLSSIVTVSLVHFMRNLGWGGLNCQYGFWPELCHRTHGGFWIQASITASVATNAKLYGERGWGEGAFT